jgi:hypothetical protein
MTSINFFERLWPSSFTFVFSHETGLRLLHVKLQMSLYNHLLGFRLLKISVLNYILTVQN